MSRKLSLIVMVAALAVLVAVPVYADPGKPVFNAGLWADDEKWGTKVTTELPAPTENNEHSFDGFFFITSVDWTPGDAYLQAPVMEAAPGNSDYNGGRWATFRVTVIDSDGIDGELTSYAEILAEEDDGDLVIAGEPEWDGNHLDKDGNHMLYFQCPLLPYK